MTLIVARVSPQTLRAVSDTRLTSLATRDRLDWRSSALKLLLLSNNRGFAYAGQSSGIADTIAACRMIRDEDDGGINALLRLLAEKSRDGQTDYIAFGSRPKIRLVKISGGTIEEGREQYWIGDPHAFDAYQRSFHSLLGRVPSKNRHDPIWIERQMEPAMKAVVESSQIPTVGDFLVPAMLDTYGLRYSPWVRLSFYPPLSELDGNPTRLRPGNAEEGSYSINMLCSTFGEPAVAFYFPEGRFGVVFCPATLDQPAILKAQTVRDFRRLAEEQHGVRMEGGCVVDPHLKLRDYRAHIPDHLQP